MDKVEVARKVLKRLIDNAVGCNAYVIAKGAESCFAKEIAAQFGTTPEEVAKIIVDVDRNLTQAIWKIGEEPQSNRILHNLMANLVGSAKGFLRNISNHEGYDHHCDCCNVMADMFNLWEHGPDGGHFPLWISRVVAGVMNDLEEEEHCVFPGR